jgi:hypothetical protein
LTNTLRGPALVPTTSALAAAAEQALARRRRHRLARPPTPPPLPWRLVGATATGVPVFLLTAFVTPFAGAHGQHPGHPGGAGGAGQPCRFAAAPPPVADRRRPAAPASDSTGMHRLAAK